MKILIYFTLLFLTLTIGCVNPTGGSGGEETGGSTLNSGFKATGNEPFWSLEIDFNKNMVFKTIGNPPFEITSPTPAPRKGGPSETRYKAESDGGMLNVSIIREKCEDSMSGKKFSYRVSIIASSKTMDSPVEVTGCGQYIGDYRIHDIWALRVLDGIPVERGAFQKGDPSLEIQIEAQRVFGYAGCNEFQGSFVLMRGGKLEMGPLSATRMACPQLDFEQKYIKALSSGPLNYSLKDLELTLKNKAHTLVFQKVD